MFLNTIKIRNEAKLLTCMTICNSKEQKIQRQERVAS